MLVCTRWAAGDNGWQRLGFRYSFDTASRCGAGGGQTPGSGGRLQRVARLLPEKGSGMEGKGNHLQIEMRNIHTGMIREVLAGWWGCAAGDGCKYDL